MRLAPIPVGVGRRVGVGDASGVITGAWNSSGASSTLNSVLQGLPPDVTAALNTGSTIIKNGKPAIDLAIKIGQGGTPNPQEVVAGFAAVAGMINPAVGAALAAGGEAVIGILDAMQAIFSALGLYTVPDRSWTYVGLLRASTAGSVNGDYVPHAPDPKTGVKDPLWLTFPDYITLWNFLGAGIQPPSVVAAGHNYQFYNPDAVSGARNAPFITAYLVALLRRQPLNKTVFSQYAAGTVSTPCRGTGYTGNVQCSMLVPATVDDSGKACCGWCTEANCGCLFMGPAPANLPTCGSSDILGQSFAEQVGNFNAFSPTPFEIYFNTLLVQNLEYWANAQPFVPVRALLAAAVTAWNSAHSSATTQCFLPENPDSKVGPDPVSGGGNFGGWTNGQQWSSGVFYKGNTISWVLGPYGGQTDAISIESDQPQICVNTGPSAASTATTSALKSAALAAVAVPSAAVGTAAVGTLAYSYATGEAFGAVVKSLWSRISAFAERFGT